MKSRRACSFRHHASPRVTLTFVVHYRDDRSGIIGVGTKVSGILAERANKCEPAYESKGPHKERKEYHKSLAALGYFLSYSRVLDEEREHCRVRIFSADVHQDPREAYSGKHSSHDD